MKSVETYIGKKYGKRTIIADAGIRKGKIVVLCRCDCGKEDVVDFYALIGGHRLQCVECQRKNQFKDLSGYIGKTYGSRTIISDEGLDKYGHHMVKCRCKCGYISLVNILGLKNGTRTKCLKCGMIGTRYKTHGKTNSRLYSIWKGMKDRCYREKNRNYKYYGGRGIKICDEWKDNFEAFYNWAMSNGYREDLTIDRIDAEGDYEPSNCRWADYEGQNINKGLQQNNNSGYAGVQRYRDNKRWVAVIGYKGHKIHLAICNTKKEALEVRNKYIRDNNLPHRIQEYKGE